MPVSRTLSAYFQILTAYNRADPWQKLFMLKGELLTACNTISPVTAQQKLRRFWYSEAVKLGVEVERLKTWK